MYIDSNPPYALEFYNLMKELDFSDSILRLPEGKTFPVEFGKGFAGILIKRPLYEKLEYIISSYKKIDVPLQDGVILIGPPGAGKVYNYQFLFIIIYSN
jgi:hypothetical protein